MKKFLRWWLGIEDLVSKESFGEFKKTCQADFNNMATMTQDHNNLCARVSNLESLKPKPKPEEPEKASEFVPFTQRRARAQRLGTNPQAYIVPKK